MRVKKLVEAYKSRVGVISTYGCGSTFWFEIPKAPDNLQLAPLIAPARYDAASAGSWPEESTPNFGKCAIRHNLGAPYVG
jgi:hypothetical protein